jgi:hypothetical protein
MPVVIRTDSDQTIHQVWIQEQASSCAVASIWMARNQARQMTANEGEWALAWSIYGRVVRGMALMAAPPPPMSLNPAAFGTDEKTFQNKFANFGTYMNQVVEALAHDGVRATHVTGFTNGNMMVDPRRLSMTTPAIVLLGWYRGSKRVGGHFIVAACQTRSGQIVYLDPGHGQLSELGSGPNYPGGGRFEQVAYLSASM